MASNYDFGDMDFQLPDFSEFMTGLQTLATINDALGDESVFRTNMEADLALLDFALEDSSVVACKSDAMRVSGKPDDVKVEAPKGRVVLVATAPPVAPPAAPPVAPPAPVAP